MRNIDRERFFMVLRMTMRGYNQWRDKRETCLELPGIATFHP
jgi:uncharacterized protein YjiS (DUF1127 family)